MANLGATTGYVDPNKVLGSTQQDLGKWGNAYYQQYVEKAAQVGATPLSQDQWVSKYYGQLNNDTNFEAGSKKWDTDFANIGIQKINDLNKQAHDWNPGIPFTAYNGATDFDSVVKGISDTTATVNANKPKNIGADGKVDTTLDATTGEKKYVFTPSEIMTQTEAQLKADATAPDAVAPTYSYNGENTAGYYDTISKSEQAGTDKAVGAVNETANMVNPYATGSGSQIKAVAGMLDQITSSQQSRAFALGQNAYDKNYSALYGQYEKAGAKKTAAQQNLLNLGQYYATMANEADSKNAALYWNNLMNSNAYNQSNLTTQATDKQYQRDTALMDKAAELNAPQKTDWWQPFVSTAVGAVTGGVGAAVGAGVQNVASGNSWGYNPYASLIASLAGKKIN
jgi:hypothetical protein